MQFYLRLEPEPLNCVKNSPANTLREGLVTFFTNCPNFLSYAKRLSTTLFAAAPRGVEAGLGGSRAGSR
jgi:hypothetical protein